MKSWGIPITIAEDAASAVASLDITGSLKGLSCVAPDMTGATYTLAIADKNGGTVFSRASIAKNTTTTIWSDKYGGTAEYSPLNTPLMGELTVTLTSVGTEAADRSFTVYVYYD